MEENFYDYQQKRTRILLAWGLGNMLTGIAGGIKSRGKFWRQFWIQCLFWGLTNALLAVFGLRAAGRKKGDATLKKDIRNYHRILFVNVFLDAGYVIGGVFSRRNGKKTGKIEREGIGTGFVVQGIYLFLYDLLLDLEVRRRWLKSSK